MSVGYRGDWRFPDDRATAVLTWWLTTVPMMQSGSPEENDDENILKWKKIQKTVRAWNLLMSREPIKRGQDGDVMASRTWWGFQVKACFASRHLTFLTHVNHQTSPSNHLPPAHTLTSLSVQLFPPLSWFSFFTFELFAVRFSTVASIFSLI